MPKIQYTIRNIPEAVDQVIRKRARESGKSFNQMVVDLLALETLGTIEPQPDDHFDWLYGANTLSASFDEAVTEQSKIELNQWQ